MVGGSYQGCTICPSRILDETPGPHKKLWIASNPKDMAIKKLFHSPTFIQNHFVTKGDDYSLNNANCKHCLYGHLSLPLTATF
jgi:hypothetical protein